MGLAFGAGGAAAFNPCGVAMLPSYVCYLLGRTDGKTAAGWKSVVDGVLVGAVMTLGFLTTFVGAGAVISLAGRAVIGVVPWLTMLIAIVMVAFGAMMFMGQHVPGLNLPGLRYRLETGSRRQLLWSVYGYGLAYAVASLGCALPIFLVLVSQSLLAGSWVGGVFTFVVFALGMGLVVTGLSVASLLSQGLLARYLPRLLPSVQRIAGLVIVGAGLYIGYYWLAGPGSLLRRL